MSTAVSGSYRLVAAFSSIMQRTYVVSQSESPVKMIWFIQHTYLELGTNIRQILFEIKK